MEKVRATTEIVFAQRRRGNTGKKCNRPTMSAAVILQVYTLILFGESISYTQKNMFQE